MSLKKPSIVLNTDEPEDKKLYEFITKLPNGKKRNASKFLRTLVDRAYQNEKSKQKTDAINVIRTEKGGISYQLNSQTKDFQK